MKTILVVEDNRIIALDIGRALKKLGYNVTITTSSGEHATEYAKILHPDLVLMDIILRGKLDGMEAARLIWSGLHTPSLFITAQTDEQTLQQAERTPGAVGLLRKPFTTAQLTAAVEKAIAGIKNAG